MPENVVLYDKQDNVGIITLNRPERLNAINRELSEELLAQLDRAREDKVSFR